MSESVESAWTIGELAERVGMSIRNIRAHQSRGLVPPPVRRGRVAYYDHRHERALTRIRALQAKGYNLTAVEELLRSAPGSQAQLSRTVLAPLLEHEEVPLTQAQIAAMFGVEPSPERLHTALDLGLLRDLGDGRYAVPNRALLDATRALVERGMSIVDVYAMQVEITRATRDVAQRFVDACLRFSLDATAGDPAAPADAVRASFDELRNQFTAVLAATFAVNVRLATESLLAIAELQADEAAAP